MTDTEELLNDQIEDMHKTIERLEAEKKEIIERLEEIRDNNLSPLNDFKIPSKEIDKLIKDIKGE